MVDDWATAWSSSDYKDPDRVLAMFVDDCVFEDVTLPWLLGAGRNFEGS